MNATSLGPAVRRVRERIAAGERLEQHDNAWWLMQFEGSAARGVPVWPEVVALLPRTTTPEANPDAL